MPTDYEIAIQHYEVADQAYKAREAYLSSGQAIADIVKGGHGPDSAMEQWHIIWRQLHEALEERNARLKDAKDLLRAAVQLTHTQWRGPTGAPTTMTVGEFKVSSVTRRSFNAATLFNLVNGKGRLQELLALTKMNKDGVLGPAVKQEFKFEFDTIVNWLTANQMLDVLSGAYEEVESTPAAKGPKVLGFLGEKKDAGSE